MGAKYKQLDMEERIEIARRRSSGETLRQIATALDRTASSIAREVKRNSAQTGRYHPIYADQQARARRWSGSKLSRDIVLQERVLGLLRQGLSPQMVCGRLQYEQGKAVLSYESIYRFIAAQIARTKDYRWRHYLPNAKSKRGWRGRKGGSSVERIASESPYTSGTHRFRLEFKRGTGKRICCCFVCMGKQYWHCMSVPRV